MEKVKNLVVGAGLSGATIARRIAELKHESVLVIDRRNHIAGNAFDYVDDETGIIVHRYGPHVFHTNDKEVWDFLSRFTEWHPFFYKVKAFIDGKLITIPFNFDSIEQAFPHNFAKRLEEKLLDNFEFNTKVSILDLEKYKDNDLKFLKQYIYNKVYKGYSLKQWGTAFDDLDESVTSRVPIYISRDDRYFLDKYQAIPKFGYTKLIENILKDDLIEIRLNTDFLHYKSVYEYENLYYTGSLDELFDYSAGALPYRSLDLQFKKLDREKYQDFAQVNYPENFDFTRICEYKHYLNQTSSKTVISVEYPCDFERDLNERFYPIENKKNESLYKLYVGYLRDQNWKNGQKSSKKYINILGRLGLYKYLNMDQVVRKALDMTKF